MAFRFPGLFTAASMILAAALCGSARAQSLDTTAINTHFARYSRNDSPGCAIAIAQNGRTLFEHAYSMADLERHIPITANTIFDAGPVSEQFTAAAVLILAARGKLSLDDDIRKWFPELHDFGEVITVRNLLQHTSGLRDWAALEWIEGWPRGSRTIGNDDVLRTMSLQRTLTHAPGAEFSYGTIGYSLAVLLVERASHESFPAFTKRELFDPIGMTHTSWRDDYSRIVDGRAEAYSMLSLPPRSLGVHLEMPAENVYGDAGLLTTVGDLLKWNDALTERRVGSPNVSQAIETPGMLKNGAPTHYGAGMFNQLHLGVPELGRRGSAAGYQSYVARYPVQHVSLAVLCNQDFYGGNAFLFLAEGAVRSIVPFRDTTYTADGGPRPPPRPTLTAAQLQEFAGTWRSDEMATPLEIKLIHDTLHLVRRPGLEGPLLPAAGPVDHLTAGAVDFRFERDANGRVVRLFASMPGALNIPYGRIP